ncbi:Protein phosphatase 2C-like protein C10F6.17c [Erysiphe neolycopersici]|uniref:Protein phosphatase 2C-like protein C10F6.17c n=1 Tax=Erysiphe neolycopersici TaxID=212602 RepID=A0A420HR19_9PEZI|nr:Protein phosphatase 2C-like protein C10F6.17c [Erysiphe neolycopersici]
MNPSFQILSKSNPRIYLIQTQSLLNIRSYSLPYQYASCPRRQFYNSPLRAKPIHMRRISAVILFGAVGYRAWQTYHNKPELPSSGHVAIDNAEFKPGVERNAVAVDPNPLYTSVIPDNEPLSKETDESGTKFLGMMTPEQATYKLRRNEESYLVGRGKGVKRYDIVQIPSNDPIEDDHAEKIVEIPSLKSEISTAKSPSSDWMFWGVFDGHSGWTTSAKLRQVLINFVARELNTAFQEAAAQNNTDSPVNEAIHTAIKTGFTRLDDEIVINNVQKTFKANSKIAAAELLAPALSGSCALLSFYDSNSKLLHVACTGDSRAVLGRRGDNGKWAALPLSEDQTGSNPNEQARIQKEHPEEEHVIRNGRVLGGLEPTRAFGDASYKWSREISERLKASFFGRTPSKLLQTPPYVTAEPVVTTTQIYPERSDFLVMATDGLWEMLSNEEVVGLVGKWIEKQESKENSLSWTSKFLGGPKNGLPIENNAQKKINQGQDGQKVPIRQVQWGLKEEERRFTVQDNNVATHLVRNALGGKNTEMVCALLSLPAPFSRRYRDDLTVQVIFFGDSNNTDGKVVVNKEATAEASNTKSKL